MTTINLAHTLDPHTFWAAAAPGSTTASETILAAAGRSITPGYGTRLKIWIEHKPGHWPAAWRVSEDGRAYRMAYRRAWSFLVNNQADRAPTRPAGIDRPDPIPWRSGDLGPYAEEEYRREQADL